MHKFQFVSTLLFLLVYYYFLFYIQTTVSSPYSPPTTSPNLQTCFLTPCPLLLHLHSVKVRPPTGVNKAWYIKLRQDKAPPLPSYIKSKQGIPSQGMGFKRPAHAPGTSLVPTTRGLTNRPSYTTVTHLQRV